MHQHITLREDDIAFLDDNSRGAHYTPDMAAMIDDPDPPKAIHAAFIAAGDSLNKILLWISQSKDVHSAGLRVFALVMILRPELLEVSTQGELAERLGVDKRVLSKYTAEIFKLGNGRFRRGQWIRGERDREVYRRRALAVHKRKKEDAG